MWDYCALLVQVALVDEDAHSRHFMWSHALRHNTDIPSDHACMLHHCCSSELLAGGHCNKHCLCLVLHPCLHVLAACYTGRKQAK